ncbi:hypothetical protein M4R22_15335 [Acidovorax sp. GBBC 3334]|uniref:hypothetical protein n=1 Tax=Acidovorax sp. GBBC 3334 TaxID=2940496 RepID=UPI002302BF49|nr:hypothetical protein [Acidovorax sp. GBBC 3334]MDA8456141.1 hypothetical protein [Acidovorax sp. GBBC 3334]
MPLFATLVSNIGAALVSLFSRFMGLFSALKLASYVTYLGITATFVTTVYVCVGGLLTYLTSFSFGGGSTTDSNWMGYFGMGLGMFVPQNAAGVLSCVGSVWIGCNVYRLQQIGTIKFT